jgi:hypothetical protein
MSADDSHFYLFGQRWRRISIREIFGLPPAAHGVIHLGKFNSPPANTPAAEGAAGGAERPDGAGMRWREAAERMERLRAGGAAWPGYREMARRLGCSKVTVSKAIRSAPELTAWAKPPAAPRAQQSLDDEKAGTQETVTQQREPDPAEDAADRELRARLEEADHEERAFLNEISGASSLFQLWYLQQSTPRQRACRKRWAAATAADPGTRAWFLGLSAADQIGFFDDPGSYPGALPRP